MDSLIIGNKTIRLSHLDKILFEKPTITKRDLVAYYYHIAPFMIPLIKQHPLSLLRFPRGIHHEKFYQKRVPASFPQWITRVRVKHRQIHGSSNYIVCNDQATLVYLANYICVPHIWLSKKDKLDYPDRMIFDLDPSITTPFSLVCTTALWLKQFLESVGMHPFAMITGSRGIHIVVPLKRTETFDSVRTFARKIANMTAAHNPEQITTEIRKEKREQKIFIDYLRNAYGATSVAPYAIRTYKKAPIAMPISWDEVNDPQLTSQRYTIGNIVTRLETTPDPWKDFYKKAISLKKPKRILERLT